ncbi:hypothetical protein RJ640_000747 [Escallonia rubra]|uniref:Anticodon-binding domain-containing protein n=1 Tax=Escallonia rubra TaxID=112253 RepID=A0AA88QE38_9ASTE|nr:hypothetical protein RJ640_000747 [Escallonia rubra]
MLAKGAPEVIVALLEWANVTRWEMRTKPFVRTLEFLWQEGHTAHATSEEAEKEWSCAGLDKHWPLHWWDHLSTLVTPQAFGGASLNLKSDLEKKAFLLGLGMLQVLDNSVTNQFFLNVVSQFTDENGQRQHVWQTSWAVSTRFVGGIIMTHGDDAGLMLPPKMAPVQRLCLSYITVGKIYCIIEFLLMRLIASRGNCSNLEEADEKAGVLNAASSVKDVLHVAGIKVKIDDSDQRTPGWKFNFWEMKGVPLRIEIGPRDVSSGSVVISRRDVPGKQGEVFGISMDASVLVAYVKDKLDEIQSSLLAKASISR